MSQMTTVNPRLRTPRPLLIVLVVALLVGAWYVLLRPIEGRAKDALARRDQVTATFQANQQRLRNLQSGKPDELGPLTEVWRRSGDLLPPSATARDIVIAMVDKFDAAGSAAGLSVSVKPTSDGVVPFPADKRLEAIEFSLSASGDLAAFGRFLTELESLEPLVVVSSMSIGGNQGSSTLTLKVLVMTTTVPLSGGSAPVPSLPSGPSGSVPLVPPTEPSSPSDLLNQITAPPAP